MKALLNEEAEMEDLFEAIESDEEFENAGMHLFITWYSMEIMLI